MTSEEEAREALKQLLWELPAEFSLHDPEDTYFHRNEFKVVTRKNVKKVHEALWTLQRFFEETS